MPKRVRRCAGLGAAEGGGRHPPSPTPESGTLDRAKPDGPGQEPHPYPTWGLRPVFAALPLWRGACCCLEMSALAVGTRSTCVLCARGRQDLFSFRDQHPNRTAPRGGLPAPFRLVHLGEAPLRRVSGPPCISPNFPIDVTKKLSKNPVGRRGSNPARTKAWGGRGRAETEAGASPRGFGKAGRGVRTLG